MRPPRVAILVLFFSASLFLVCRSISSIRRARPTVTPLTTTSPKSPFRTFFTFTAPFSLFPPSAAISLTDDNSTFFPARPAAFGPPLPNNGLSGQLWIGSGFSDENLQEDEGEGELGCSDIPGWEDGRTKAAIQMTKPGSTSSKSSPATLDVTNSKRNALVADALAGQEHGEKRRPRPVYDGTDDYLHEGLKQARSASDHRPTASGSKHADIQSIQETAEITGKIALLSRGGCGFLEKVKWAQRRGAIALIVGDNQKGGPLIQMFARGNVDNVTIPSVFTSRTTAHLLSSLMQPGSFIEDMVDESGNPMLKVQKSAKTASSKKSKAASSATRTPKTTPASKPGQRARTAKAKKAGTAPRGLFSRLFNWGGGQRITPDTSRPPSSGRLDWITTNRGSDESDGRTKHTLDKVSNQQTKGNTPSSSSDTRTGDDFQIGVQDWRDPDLVESSPDHREVFPQGSKELVKDDPKGGSITPGSGEYRPEVKGDSESPETRKSESPSALHDGLVTKIFGGHDEGDATSNGNPEPPTRVSPPITQLQEKNGGREGLWVTITPTGSASPFFDTLLVLVISPLITLTVVYALLILRVKIRMRRWRAPKSVVDRLPVRTYHTVAPSPTLTPRAPSPASSSPTTPLLQGSSRSRSHSPRAEDALQVPRTPSREKNARRGGSEWKKYMGRQVECVVCLEEYVDGVSKVMSLPCGHEFHVECM